MSSSAQKLDDASILRKFELSQKEAALKARLFTNKSAQKTKSASKMARESSKTMQSTNFENSNPNIPDHRSITQSQLSSGQLKDYEIEKFLSSMESEFREVNKKQVTMGMLSSQQQILKQHTEILNSNQQAITQILTVNTNGRENSKAQSSAQTIESQKELLRELIAPLNTQIAEIRQLYEQTKEKAELAAREVAQSKNQSLKNEQEVLARFDKMKDYQSSSTDLKEKAYDAQTRLNNLLPENLLAVKQISNLNIQAYTDCINSLKNQLDTLQKDADKAEKELEQRYQKLNKLSKPPLKLKANDPLYHVVEHGHEGSAEIVKSLQNIDFDVSRKTVQAKLGGEFHYENFIDEVSEIANEVKSIRSTLESGLHEYAIIIPSSICLDEEDNLNLERMAQLPSIIDEIKARYRIPNNLKALQQLQSQNKIIPVPVPEPQIRDQSPISEVKFKRSHQRPEALLNLKTIPVLPQPDVKFTKVETKPIAPERITPSETIFSNLPKHKRGEVSRRSSSVQYNSIEQFASTNENFASNQTVVDRPVQQEGLRITTQSETQSQYSSPQKTAQNQYIQHKVRFGEPNGDDETFRMKVPQPKSEEKLPRAQNEKQSTFLDKEILRDIKDELIRINHRIEQEDDHNLHASQIEQSIYPKASYENPRLPKDHCLIAGNLRSVSLLEANAPPRDFSMRLVVLPEKIPVIEDQKVVEEVAMSMFSEKLKQIIAEEKQRDDSNKDELFKPVEMVNVDKIIQEKPQCNVQMQPELLKNTNQAKELSNLLTENMLDLFATAVQQINTSLAKNLPATQEQKKSPKGSIMELFGARRESAAFSDKSLIQDKASQEEVRDRDLKRNPHPTSDKLAIEAKLTHEEIEMMKYYNPFSKGEKQIESKPLERRQSVPSNEQYYFYENSPKPIADYSDYCRDLESEASSMGNYMLKSFALAYKQGKERRASLSSNKLHSFSNEISFI